jgi:hypothetical protein
MSSASVSLHETGENLSPELVDRHRAIVSIMEELEAVDWYDQRAAAATDPELREIIAHNRDEEKEHAMMLLEWLRRRDATFREVVGTYLNSEGSIVRAEEEATGADNGAVDAGGEPLSDGSLGIGSLRGEG